MSDDRPLFETWAEPTDGAISPTLAPRRPPTGGQPGEVCETAAEADSPGVAASPIREKCLAVPKGGGPPCQKPVGQCRDHCGAALRGERAGRFCPMPPCRGSTRCRMHGGRSPAGIGHPRFKGGKYSKYLPKGIRSSYERAIGDPTLLSLHDDLALLEVRQVELMKRLSQAPPPWGEALELYNRAAGAGSDQQQTALLEQLGALLLEGAKAASAQEQAWAELRELVQEKARTAAAEVRQLVELGQTLTTEQALMLVKQLSQAVRENVKDPQVLRAIQRSLDALVLEDETGCRRRQRAEDGE